MLAYSEFVFRDELWPDFSREVFEASLEEYAARQRRFGGAMSDGGALRARPRPGGSLAVAQIPAVLFAILIVWQGGEVFALGV